MGKKRNLSVIEYFNRRADENEARLRFAGKTKRDFEKWKRELLAELDVLLGPRPKAVDLNPEIEWEVEEDGLIKRRVLLDTEEHMSVAALV